MRTKKGRGGAATFGTSCETSLIASQKDFPHEQIINCKTVVDGNVHSMSLQACLKNRLNKGKKSERKNLLNFSVILVIVPVMLTDKG